jgi:hypothetical protein
MYNVPSTAGTGVAELGPTMADEPDAPDEQDATIRVRPRLRMIATVRLVARIWW